jgi:hypothetical protein
MKHYIGYLWTKKAHDSVRREVLHNTLIEFGIPMKTSQAHSDVFKWNIQEIPISKHLSDAFPIQNGLKQGDALSPLLLNVV